MRIGVVGAGIAGLGAARALARTHEVWVLEAADRAGGHANTRAIAIEGRQIAVDTGFIVFNQRNYPLLTRLFAELGVAHRASDMSFSVSLDDGAYEYEGSPRGLFAQPGNALRPSHWRMIAETLRFYRTAPRLLETAGDGDMTLGALLAAGGYSRTFADRHILPMGGAIWSASLAEMERFPARRFVRFFVNHGLFDLSGRPQWRTVSGGSRSYVARMTEGLADKLLLGHAVRAVQRQPVGVAVVDAQGAIHQFDHVVVATHTDQALRLLGSDATPAELSVLGGFRYRSNRAVLHSDPALMPRRRSAWASWNYLARKRTDQRDGQVCVSYWMNRLQDLPVRTPVIVTLNPTREPAPDRVHYETWYDHPQFDAAADRAQRGLAGIQGNGGLWFCGSYCGDGFHEDALQAGLDVAKAIGQRAGQSKAAGRLPTFTPAAA